MMDHQPDIATGVEKLKTYITGFDGIANDGLPKGRTTLVSGTAGSGKTVFAAQFLSAGILNTDEHGVFVTFEETPDDIRRNKRGFGWDIETWEKEGRWAFVDASPQPDNEAIIVGQYDLGALLARLEHAIKKVGAQRVVLDSLGSIFARFTDATVVRSELFRIATLLRKLEVTAIITAERVEEYGEIARYNVEEFVADNVIVLRNILDDEKRRRTIEILKFRGALHQKGEYPFTILPGRGVVVLPLSSIELKQKSSDARATSGNKEMDELCGGGFFRDSIVLASGATGTGKTLMVTEFMAGGGAGGERCLLFAFEESRDQLMRNARGWGMDLEAMEQAGNLRIVATYPEVAGLDDHLLRIKEMIEEYKPNRIAVDSLSALERVSNPKGFREFVIGLTSFVKEKEVVGLFTSTTPTLMGGSSVTEEHISTITDTIILLRYVETFGEMRRGLTVLKMRGSLHKKEIREFTIDQHGMHIGLPFREVSGVLSGNIMRITTDELQRIRHMFKD